MEKVVMSSICFPADIAHRSRPPEDFTPGANYDPTTFESNAQRRFPGMVTRNYRMEADALACAYMLKTESSPHVETCIQHICLGN